MSIAVQWELPSYTEFLVLIPESQIPLVSGPFVYRYNNTVLDKEVRNWISLSISRLYLDLRNLNSMPVKIWGRNYF